MTDQPEPTARQRLLDAMRNRVCFCGAESCSSAEPLINAYAHELAETIRNADYPAHATDGADYAADLIDPDVKP